MENKTYRLIYAEQEIDERFDSEQELLEAIVDDHTWMKAYDPRLLVLIGNDDAWASMSRYQLESALQSYKFEQEENLACERDYIRSVRNASRDYSLMGAI